jgi:hypothetical protein
MVMVVVTTISAMRVRVSMRGRYRRAARRLLGETGRGRVIALSIHWQFPSDHFRYERTTSINSSAPFARSAWLVIAGLATCVRT